MVRLPSRDGCLEDEIDKSLTVASVLPNRGRGQTLLYQAVEGAEILRRPESKATINLHGGPQPGAGYVEGGDHGARFARLFAAAGIGREEPDAIPAAAQHFSEVAAPETRLEVEIDGG